MMAPTSFSVSGDTRCIAPVRPCAAHRGWFQWAPAVLLPRHMGKVFCNQPLAMCAYFLNLNMHMHRDVHLFGDILWRFHRTCSASHQIFKAYNRAYAHRQLSTHALQHNTAQQASTSRNQVLGLCHRRQRNESALIRLIRQSAPSCHASVHAPPPNKGSISYWRGPSSFPQNSFAESMQACVVFL